jgi:hypothetical protein
MARSTKASRKGNRKGRKGARRARRVLPSRVSLALDLYAALADRRAVAAVLSLPARARRVVVAALGARS